METIPKLAIDQEFVTWKLLMKDFLIENDAALWRSITDGPYVPMTDNAIPKDPSNYTDQDIKRMDVDRKAHAILAKLLTDTTYEGLVLVHSDQSAKELWDSLCKCHIPKGRHLSGDRVVYDIDVRLPGEAQPQLKIIPITKYGSDPALVVGRQIAVNSNYICYALKLGAIRVININAALRSLLKDLTQRVTDMVFFAEDVNLLASASKDGQVYVWNITEVTDEDGNAQITRDLVIAIQIVGEEKFAHPRVCWHCREQDIVIVGIGNRVLRIDTTKVGRGEVYSAEKPLKCPIDKLINGVQFVGNHDGEVTDLSMCKSMTTRLVSASIDGTIKIWEDQKSTPIAVLRPHDGLPVNSVTFLTAPHCPEHIILITGGPLNREVKIWHPSDADSWHCLQTLELRSSSESRFEDAFFNQVAALPQAGLVLLANAKKNAIYVVHLEYGPNPESTRMDYIAEFAVTMPILSFTSKHEKQIVHVYCVQTQAIQCHDLDMSQCLPPAIDKQDSVKGLNVSEPTSTKTSLDVGSFSRQMDHLQLHL